MKSALTRPVIAVLCVAALRCGSSDGSLGLDGTGSDAGPDGSVGGSAGSGGSAGQSAGGSAGTNTGGSAGAAGSASTRSYLLWAKDQSARIWRLSGTGAFVDEKTLTTSEDGFVARDLDVLRDGTARLLWTNGAGQSRLWKLDDQLEKVSEATYSAAQPSAGWGATSYAKLPDGSGRVVWFNPSVGSAVVWALGSDDTYTNGAKKNYTPSADVGSWVPSSYFGPFDNTARLLWSFEGAANSAAGQHAVVWHLDPLESKSVAKIVNYQPGWFARSYHVEDAGRVRMLWTNDFDGRGLLCTYASDSAVLGVDDSAPGFGDGQCLSFGPEAGFTLRAYTREECLPGTCPAPCIDDVKLPHLPAPPASLSATGFDASLGGAAPYIEPFQPRFVLWSDGAVKERFAYIPKCSKIDTSDMDHWQMPVGSRFWKKFTQNGVHVETRLIHRYGPGTDDWIFAAYQQVAAGGVHVPAGVQNANGTPHDIPSAAQCNQCHGKLVEHVLSFSAIQLSHALSGETIASLSNEGRLTVPHAQGFDPPGDTDTQAALGYLHANCGNCHNDADSFLDMRLRLLVSQTTTAQTGLFQTSINVPTKNFDCLGSGAGTCDRIEPGDPAQSAILMRLQTKGQGVQMPPIGTEVLDTTGVDIISAFVKGL